MKLWKKLISVVSLQLFGVFLIQPIFALSSENIEIVSLTNYADSCGINIQCYEVRENEYRCNQTDSGINSAQGYVGNIQIGKNDNTISHFSSLNFGEQHIDIHDKKSLYQDPKGDIYPFVGIIKIQV